MGEATEKAPSIWSITFIALLVINFFFSMGQMMSNNILPLYARDLGVSATIIGFVVSSFYIAALCIRPFAGPTYDSFSKKRLLQITYAITIVACFAYVFAKSVPALIAARIVHGFAVGSIAPLSFSFVSDVLPKERLGSGVSIYTTAQVLAQVIGPALGIELSRMIGYSNTYLIAAVMMLLAGILTFFIKEDPPAQKRPSYRLSLDRIIVRQALAPAGCLMLSAVGFSSITSFITIYAEAQGIMQIGIYFMVYAIVMMFVRLVGGQLADRYGADAVLIPSIIIFAAAFLILSFARSLPVFILVAVIAAFGYGSAYPLMQTMALRSVPRAKSGAASNTNYFGIDIGFLLGPLIGGSLVDALMPLCPTDVIAYATMYRIIAAFVLLALVLYVSQRKRMARYEAEAAAIDEAAAQSAGGR